MYCVIVKSDVQDFFPHMDFVQRRNIMRALENIRIFLIVPFGDDVYYITVLILKN